MPFQTSMFLLCTSWAKAMMTFHGIYFFTGTIPSNFLITYPSNNWILLFVRFSLDLFSYIIISNTNINFFSICQLKSLKYEPFLKWKGLLLLSRLIIFVYECFRRHLGLLVGKSYYSLLYLQNYLRYPSIGWLRECWLSFCQPIFAPFNS